MRDDSPAIQELLHLLPGDPFSLNYLVVHSGISRAVELLNLTADRPGQGGAFNLHYLHGPAGSGKTHILTAFSSKFRAAAPTEAEVEAFDYGAGGAEFDLPGFIAVYERVKARGGALLVASRAAPVELCPDPQFISRVGSAAAELSYPRESELPELISSLAERHNLRLSERAVRLLLRSLPRDPLSFDSILAKIAASSLKQARPANQTVVREALVKNERRGE
jgi:chromosomal replication initiation ATPase DnaA